MQARLAENVSSSHNRFLLVATLFVAVLLPACESSLAPAVPRSATALDVAAPAPGTAREYLIAPLDRLRVQVLYEPELSANDIQVDAAGNISLPLIGGVAAAGHSPDALAATITQRLDQYLRNPRVTVSVVASTRQRVVVEGQVAEPGVYEIAGSATLLEALARAKSPTRTAALDEIVIFRNINGQRHGAVFDLRRIRAGLDPDPIILGGDVIVVGFDELKGAFRAFVEVIPAIAIFRPY